MSHEDEYEDENDTINLLEKLNPINKKLIALVTAYTKLHIAIKDILSKTGDYVRDKNFSHPEWSKKDVVDHGYLCRFLVRTLATDRLMFAYRTEAVDRILARGLLEETMKNLEQATTIVKQKIEGNMGSASLNILPYAVIPKKDTPEFDLLLKHFGVSNEVIRNKILMFRWKNFMVNIVNPLVVDGKPMPPGINTRNPMLKVRYNNSKLGRELLQEVCQALLGDVEKMDEKEGEWNDEPEPESSSET